MPAEWPKVAVDHLEVCSGCERAGGCWRVGAWRVCGSSCSRCHHGRGKDRQQSSQEEWFREVEAVECSKLPARQADETGDHSDKCVRNNNEGAPNKGKMLSKMDVKVGV